MKATTLLETDSKA